MTATIAVVGSTMMDMVIRVPRRPAPGETVFGTEFGMYLGGKGFNQAVAARRMGASVRMCGRVGDDDFGRRILAALDAEGIDRGGVGVDTEAGTGIAVPVIDAAGENSIVSVPRANLRLTPAHIEASAAAFVGIDALLLQLETPIDASVTAARLARDRGARVLLNIAPAGDVPLVLLELVDVIIANEHEARALTGVVVIDVETAQQAATQLRARVGGAAVVTLGPVGAVADADSAGWHSPGFSVEALDTTGAGDAFCGALCVRLAEGANLADALRWANAAGACAVSILGAEPSLPWRANVATRFGSAAGGVSSPPMTRARKSIP